MSNAPVSTIRRLITHRIITRGRLARRTESLARAFAHPEGAGVMGPDARNLLRTVLVDALVDGPERLDVVIARPDLKQLLGNASLPSERLTPALHMPATLEDTIEHLESRLSPTSLTEARPHRPTLWLATPGPDADVVHQTLTHLPTANLIALFQGPWPYGPTHFIEANGPRHLPTQNLNLLSRNQAAARLHIPNTR
ncbi:hypothetical protein [Actinomadura napierensis]|uniref:Uncharacterized protein n=1 Tax=Actinomadura napierensis TaxID=267854 RepID=A0ABP5KA27_9ACTN